VFLLFNIFRVFTVFSTSKDHRQGETAMAGCILIDNEKIQVINRSPKYKNKYVHRRTSVSLENLSPKEVSSPLLSCFLRLPYAFPHFPFLLFPSLVRSSHSLRKEED
jgi:hypothetical protein